MSILQTAPFTPFHTVKEAGNKSLSKRIWNAVVDFFTVVAKKIKTGAIFAWATLRTWVVGPEKPPELPKPTEAAVAHPISVHASPVLLPVVTPRPLGARRYPQTPPVYVPPPVASAPRRHLIFRSFAFLVRFFSRPQAPLSDSVIAKLARYQDMPKTDTQFLQDSIDIARETLQRKDPKLVAPFNDELENFLPGGLQKAMIAAIRASLFSEDGFCPSFLGSYQTVPDPQFPVFQGHAIKFVKFVSGQPQIQKLKKAFEALDSHSKEVILDEFSPDGIDKMELLENGKKIMQEIVALSLEYLHTNRAASFQKCFQSIR